MSSETKTAVVYRMVMDDHLCPYGIKTRDLLKRKGYEVEDHHLNNREEVEAFQDMHDVDSTPQTFIDGERIGGYDDVREYFGLEDKEADEGTSYQPVIAVFATTFLMALAISWFTNNSIEIGVTIRMFIAISMCVLAILKLRDLYAFSNMFVTYDLLSMRWVPYAYVYPFVEMLAGVLMIANTWILVAAPAALFIGAEGAISVFKAVYIDKRELTCACVGGDSNVPLGFISLTENLMMAGMGLWMLGMMISG